MDTQELRDLIEKWLGWEIPSAVEIKFVGDDKVQVILTDYRRTINLGVSPAIVRFVNIIKHFYGSYHDKPFDGLKYMGIDLTPTEARIVKNLLDYKGEYISPERLSYKVAGYYGAEGSIAFHISNIRKKGIDIENKKYKGYKLEEGNCWECKTRSFGSPV